MTLQAASQMHIYASAAVKCLLGRATQYDEAAVEEEPVAVGNKITRKIELDAEDEAEILVCPSIHATPSDIFFR
jgi:hypothetical protein